MKNRLDYVTNSSSSSFIIARSEELNDKQKEEMVKYVAKSFLGKPVLTPNSTEEDMNRVFEEYWDFKDEEIQQQVRAALGKGKSVYSGYVCFRNSVNNYVGVFQDIWKIMQDNGDGTFLWKDEELRY